MKTILIPAFCTVLTVAVAQPYQEKPAPQNFARKFLWGISYVQGWSDIINDSQPQNFFTKPSLGAAIQAEYFFKSFVGVGVGAGFQQRGAGIRRPGIGPDPGNNSSLINRERLRFGTLEFPVSVMVRTPNDLFKKFRIGGSVSVIPVMNVRTRDVINVLEPSLDTQDSSNNTAASWFSSDLAYRFSAGPEFPCGAGIFKVHFFAGRGTSNVYKTASVKGHNQLSGIRLTILF